MINVIARLDPSAVKNKEITVRIVPQPQKEAQ